MIRYADRHARPLPSIALLTGSPVSEATLAELSAKATGRVMEIVPDPLEEVKKEIESYTYKAKQAFDEQRWGTETGRISSDRPNVKEKPMPLCRRCGQPMPEGQGYEHFACGKPPSACQRVSDYRTAAEKAEDDRDEAMIDAAIRQVEEDKDGSR